MCFLPVAIYNATSLKLFTKNMIGMRDKIGAAGIVEPRSRRAEQDSAVHCPDFVTHSYSCIYFN